MPALPPQELMAPLWVFQASCVEALLARAEVAGEVPVGGAGAVEHLAGEIGVEVEVKRGTPLASALRVLSAEFRNERMMRAEEKAARLPAIMTVPLILFILPTLFIVILGPAACSISDSFINS